MCAEQPGVTDTDTPSNKSGPGPREASMSEVKARVSFQDQPFTSQHEVEDLVKYFVSARWKYIQRWFEEKQLQVPQIAISVRDTMIVMEMEGSVRKAQCRSEAANELNVIWIESLIRMSSFSLPKLDELIQPWLGASYGSLEAEDQALMKVALRIGQRNPWIRHASDPIFDEKSFAKVRSIAALESVFEHGNWSLGSAFIYRDLAFINQVNGGDEWLVIRTDAGDFESWSARYAYHQDSTAVRRFVSDCLAATAEQLQQLEYVGASLNQA